MVLIRALVGGLRFMAVGGVVMGPAGSGGWCWAVVMACRVSWAGGERCRRLNEV